MSDAVVPVRRIHEESIVTGEAVELEVRPASPFLRIAAFVVDGLVTILVLLIVVIIASRVIEEPTTSMVRILLIGLVVLAWLVVPVAVEVSTRGRSLGKWAFGLQVVRDDGGVITARHSLMRVLTGIVELWLCLGSIALLTALVAPRSKRLGDLAAGTMVVRVPEPVVNRPLLMPPDLEVWVSSAQILQPPADLQTEALAFLRTASSMKPSIRRPSAESLATRMSAHVAPLPPAGTDPERFLAAVLVVVRDREYDRMTRRDEASDRRRLSATAAPYGI